MNALGVCLVVLLVLQGAVYNGYADVVKEVSHEDLRDAILSLVHMFRDNTDKLERHEYRERQLGEQLKKAFSNVEKKQKNEETNTETILNLLNNISARLEILENATTQRNQNEPVLSKPNKIEETLALRFSNLEEAVETNRLVIHDISVNLNQKLNSLVSAVNNVQLVTTSLQQQIAQQTPTETSKVNAITELQPKLQEQILKVQESILEKTTELSNKVTENLRRSVSVDDLNQLNSSSSDSLRDIKNELITFNENEINKLHEEIGKSLQMLSQEQQTILTTVTSSYSAIDSVNSNLQKDFENLLKELKGISKIEQVLIQTADNILDVKRRIEYGNHEILLEVGDVITHQSKELNQSLAKRFDVISLEISNSQNGALTNLSRKIEMEISQVWRQIGTMYQTLTNSADTLDKLQQHTEIYVNGSLTTLDHMEGKVSQITSRMAEVDDNLNYLLGRLSLVTQEFNQIKTGLGDALDNIRNSFHIVQNKVKDVGPGPNPIEEEVKTTDNQLLKTLYSVN